METGTQSVLITVDKDRAYLLAPKVEKYISVPKIDADGSALDEIGCGDQAKASLCAYLRVGKPIEEAVEVAEISGTLQFRKRNVQPVTKAELEAALA